MLQNILIFLAAAYCAALVFAYAFQSRLVYYPQAGRLTPGTPKDIGLDFTAVTLETADGEKLSAWWVPAAKARGTALICHGNAGNIAGRLDYIGMFSRMGYSSFVMDYRGYGQSTGVPSEEGTYRDAEAAWRWLTEERGVKAGEVAVLGESLGGAVAARLAARTAPRALVLVSAFTSVPALGAEIYPFLPVRLLSRFSYDTLGALKSLNAPVLVAHATEDAIVPFAHGKALFEAAKEPKRFLEARGSCAHGFLFTEPEQIAQLKDFLDSAAKQLRK